MKICLKKLSVGLTITGCALMTALGEPANQKATAIQAVQQAPDPSAVVAAFANGSASFRNDPQLLEAYVSRMTDLGLPEIAYHQAQTLTSLEPTNGLAWAVVAHVDARRGLMPDAISAINQAAMLNPDNFFVQQTAGEILAWYDVKADKATLPENGKQGLEKTRGLLAGRLAYVNTYNAANRAYTAQTTNPNPYQQQYPTQTVPQQPPSQPQSYYTAPNDDQTGDQYAGVGPYSPAYNPYSPSPYYSYYPYYSSYYVNPPYYGWGWWPGWWWAPSGVFFGVTFFSSHNHDFDHGHGHYDMHQDFHAHDYGHYSTYHSGSMHSYYSPHGTYASHGYHSWSSAPQGGMPGGFHGSSAGGYHGGGAHGGGGGGHGGGGHR